MRQATKISERLLAYCKVYKVKSISRDIALDFLKTLGIDEYGRDKLDRAYIEYVYHHGILAVSNIAKYLNVSEAEVKDKIEPYLVRRNWIIVAQKGRKLTDEAVKHFFTQTKENSVQTILTELELLP